VEDAIDIECEKIFAAPLGLVHRRPGFLDHIEEIEAARFCRNPEYVLFTGIRSMANVGSDVRASADRPSGFRQKGCRFSSFRVITYESVAPGAQPQIAFVVFVNTVDKRAGAGEIAVYVVMDERLRLGFIHIETAKGPDPDPSSAILIEGCDLVLVDRRRILRIVKKMCERASLLI